MAISVIVLESLRDLSCLCHHKPSENPSTLIFSIYPVTDRGMRGLTQLSLRVSRIRGYSTLPDKQQTIQKCMYSICGRKGGVGVFSQV